MSGVQLRAQSDMVEFTIQFKNPAPENGTYLTPFWVGFHDGNFDLFDMGSPASPELERLAEDGNAAPLMEAFGNAMGTGHQEMVTSGAEPPVFAPGQMRMVTFRLDPMDPKNRYLSFASMVIPSNDAFIANENPMQFQVFDEDGHFVLSDFMVGGMMVYDAGTEMNDEIPENTAFLGQAAPNTGVTENGMVGMHPGFMEGGSILTNPMFSAADFSMDGYKVFMAAVMATPGPQPVEFTIQFKNPAPENGTYLTPFWVGFHDGNFDLFDMGSPASPELERLAEDGNAAPLMEAFGNAMGTGHQEMVTSGAEPPVFAPGQMRMMTFRLDPMDPKNRYLSFASMVIPSNDAFIANENPMQFQVFDENGHFVLSDFMVGGMMVYDAGTEMNDEIPENTAFLAQAAPDTGVTENGMVSMHPGFMDGGSILSNPMFSAADFSMDGYKVFMAAVMATPGPQPVEFTIQFKNPAPENGTYLTPFWVGFHDGNFDLFDMGSPASAELERLAEDGNAAPLMEAFGNAMGTGHQEMVTSGAEPPVFAPGQMRMVTFRLDPRDPKNRYLSFASMVIPSNDAFIANENPMQFQVFDEDGHFVLSDFMVGGMMVYDAGTEMNDEIPENTAFLAQAAPDTGVTENGMASMHPGFIEGGSILTNPMFSAADFTMDGYKVFMAGVMAAPGPQPVEFTIQFKNPAPENGTYLTPFWVGFHDGNFDLFDMGSPASAELERLAEDGNAAPLMEAFGNAMGTGHQEMVTSGAEPPVFAPGQMRMVTFRLDPMDPKNRYLSFASMVIPSNDAFIANENPMQYQVFDENGHFVLSDFMVGGMMVYDAGTEMNDEIPENTAFLAQAAPDTGVTENGMVSIHPGFMEGGSILTNPMFSAADFTMDGYQVFMAQVLRNPVITSIAVNGNLVTLGWMGTQPAYQVQWTNDLVGGNWMDLGEPTSEMSVTLELDEPIAFFRVAGMPIARAGNARYSIEFSAVWSRQTHPMNFPPGPHFSGLIGATHNSDVSYWMNGAMASPGIEQMAETGGKTMLQQEIMTSINQGSSGAVLSGGGIGLSPGSRALEFDISDTHPLVTLVSMIAPSPDWFVGVHGLNLIQNGNWVNELTVDLYPYDAGTDSGPDYVSPNQNTMPAEPISRITGAPLLNGDSVPPLGTFTFRRIN